MGKERGVHLAEHALALGDGFAEHGVAEGGDSGSLVPGGAEEREFRAVKFDAHGELLLGRGGEVQALEHLRRDGVLGQGADAALDVTQELGEFLLGGGVHEFLDEEMAVEGLGEGRNLGSALRVHRFALLGGAVLEQGLDDAATLVVVGDVRHLALAGFEDGDDERALVGGGIFLTRSRSQRATISWMSVKLGFWSAFCWLDHSFCSLRVVATCLGASECFLEVSPPAPEAVESPPPDSRFASLSPLDLLGASPPPPPSALRFLLTLPSAFLRFSAGSGAVNASPPPTGFTLCGPTPGLNLAWRRSARFFAAPPPGAFIARGMVASWRTRRATAEGRDPSLESETALEERCAVARRCASCGGACAGAPGGVRRPRPRTRRRRRQIDAPEDRRRASSSARSVRLADSSSSSRNTAHGRSLRRRQPRRSRGCTVGRAMKRAAARAAGAPLRRPRVLPMSARESSGHVTLALVTCAVTLLVLVVGTHWQHQHPDDYFDEAVAAATREKTARLDPQCRACGTLLGAVEWHEPWWYESRAAWDWARSKSLPGVYDDEDYAEAYSLRMPRHPRSACGFHKMTPREARHVMRGQTVLFIGNSISRRLMYAVADAMGRRPPRG